MIIGQVLKDFPVLKRVVCYSIMTTKIVLIIIITVKCLKPVSFVLSSLACINIIIIVVIVESEN